MSASTTPVVTNRATITPTTMPTTGDVGARDTIAFADTALTVSIDATSMNAGVAAGDAG
jgi:hypothetical protein